MTPSDTPSQMSEENLNKNISETTSQIDVAASPVGPSWLDQDDTLRNMWSENKSPEEISVALGRSVAAIMTRAARLGLPRRAAPGRKRGYKRAEAPKKLAAAGTSRVRVTLPVYDDDAEYRSQQQVMPRVCLMCLGKFQSQGRHNRICPTCKGSAEYATGSSTPDFSFKVIS